MTSADLAFCDGLGSNMDEKAAAEDSGGTGAVRDMGLCIEKKEETRMSGALCKQGAYLLKEQCTYQHRANAPSKVHLVDS